MVLKEFTLKGGGNRSSREAKGKHSKVFTNPAQKCLELFNLRKTGSLQVGVANHRKIDGRVVCVTLLFLLLLFAVPSILFTLPILNNFPSSIC